MPLTIQMILLNPSNVYNDGPGTMLNKGQWHTENGAIIMYRK